MDRFTLTRINPLLHRTGNRTPMVRLTPEAYSLWTTWPTRCTICGTRW